MRTIFVRNVWVLCVVGLIQLNTVVAQTENEETSLSLPIDGSSLDLHSNLPEDGTLNFTELAIKYGFECEEHEVVTEDGYILTIFNVKGNKSQPVLAVHGVIDSADTFMVRGNTSMVAALCRKGYDVWVGSCRGSIYGRRHLTLDPVINKKAFFDYSQHEMGIYDIPAMVDYVLNQTGQSQLRAIGHSQGNMIFYILTSEKPEYNDKIKLFIALAPICYLSHLKGVLPLLVPAWPALSTALKLSGSEDILSKNSTLKQIIKVLCTQKAIGYPICSPVIFAGAGADAEEFEPAFLPVLIGHYPDAVSVKNVDHLVQVVMKKRFCKFDYGLLKNLQLYKSVEPPDYDLKNVRMRVALLTGKNDNLSSLEDVELLREQLPNVVYNHVMERDEFNHVDFVWGIHMEEYLFPIIFELLQDYQNATVVSIDGTSNDNLIV